MKNTVRSMLLIATGVAAGAAIALGVERLVGKAAEERVKGDSLAVAPAAPLDTVREIRSLDELFAIDPRDTVIGSCNLSHLGLKVLPDLSQYTIRRLDLSHNAFAGDFPEGRFPRGLEDLSVAYNKIVTFTFPNDLKRLDISHNNLHKYFAAKDSVSGGLYAADCDSAFALRYLDVSYNWNMPSSWYFDPQEVDTLIHVHAARNKTLKKQPEYGEEKLGISCRLTVHVSDILSGGKDTTAGK